MSGSLAFLNKVKYRLKDSVNPAIFLGMIDLDGVRKYHNWSRRFRKGIYNERRDIISELTPFAGDFKIDPDVGYMTLNGFDLLPEITQELITKAKQIFDVLSPEELNQIIFKTPNKKAFYTHIPLKDVDKNLDSPFTRLAMHPGILRIISEYMGMLPLLFWIMYYYSPPFKLEGDPVSSQLYHFDHEDAWSIKIYFFVEDVTEESGPMTVVTAKASERFHQATGKIKPMGKRHTDAAVYKHVDQSTEAKSITGPAGTIALIDTNRCLHYGSRTGALDRKVIGYEFLSPFGVALPWRFRKGLELNRLYSKDLPLYQRLLLGGK